MVLNKFQLKARLFELIDPVRKKGAIDDATFNRIENSLIELGKENADFISRILIKEADYRYKSPSLAFLYLAKKLAPDSFRANITDQLNSDLVDDNQKLFLINLMSGFGMKFPLDNIENYLKNPEEAYDYETASFMQDAEIDPAAQIDFLDFYFASSKEDRNSLIDSVVSAYDGDKLVNMLAPLLSVTKDEALGEYIISIMEQEKSLHSIKPLKYLARSKNKKLAARAEKLLRKFSLSGLYTEEKLYNFYKDILADFDEPVFRISLPDGNSNFTIMVSRKHSNGACYALFAAINAKFGPFSIFGFPSVAKADLDIAIRRFYGSMPEFYLPSPVGKKILEDLAFMRAENFKDMPYEFYCWERVIADIPPYNAEFAEIVCSGMRNIEIGEFEEKVISKELFIENWFYRYSIKTIPAFNKMIDEISKLDVAGLSPLEDIIKNYSTQKDIVNDIKIRLAYLVICLKYSKYKLFAEIYFAILRDDVRNNLFVQNILKKSVYEHMLWISHPQKNKVPFDRLTVTKQKAGAFIEYIEKNWVGE